MARIERTDRPDKRTEKENQHSRTTCCEAPPGAVVRAGPTKIPTPTNPPASPSKTSGRWPERRAAKPGEERDVDRHRRDQERSQTGRDPLLRDRHAAVAEKEKTGANDESRPPFREGRSRRALPAGDCVHDDPGEEEARARHEQAAGSIDRETNPEIGGTPNEVKGSESGDDRDFAWGAAASLTKSDLPSTDRRCCYIRAPPRSQACLAQKTRFVLHELGAFPGVELGNDDRAPGRHARA